MNQIKPKEAFSMRTDVHYHFKVTRVFDIETKKTIIKFACADCVKWRFCSRSFKERENCDLYRTIDKEPNINLVGKVTAWEGAQYYINPSKRNKKYLKKIFDAYTKIK